MIGTQMKLAAEKINTQMLQCTGDCKTFLLERRIVLLCRRQFLQKERNGALDCTVITMQQHGADCNYRGICVDDKRLLEVGMSVSEAAQSRRLISSNDSKCFALSLLDSPS